MVRNTDAHRYVARHLLAAFGGINVTVGLAYLAIEICAIVYGATYAYLGYCIWAGLTWCIIHGAISINSSRIFDMHWCRVTIATAVVSLLVNLVVIILFCIAITTDLVYNTTRCVLLDTLKIMLGIILSYVALHQIIALDNYSKYAAVDRNGATPVQVITVQVPAQQHPTILVQQPQQPIMQMPVAQYQQSYQPTAPPPYPNNKSGKNSRRRT